MEYNLTEIQDNLKLLFTDKRFMHSLGVQYTSANLAMRYGFDIKKAELTGLLHDCAKYMTDQEMLLNCIKNHIPMNQVEEKCPCLLHAKLGAFYAQNVYNIREQDILDAITYHTTGKPNMSFLEKIIYVADYIEPSRKKQDGLDEIRRISYDNLDMAVYLILKNTFKYLQNDDKRDIDPQTEKAFEYYKKLIIIQK